MEESGIVCLPTELLLHTFALLDSADLCRASLVCSLWKSVSSTSSLWKRLALSRWKHWKGEKEFDDWRNVYMSRSELEVQMVALLQEVRKSPETRMRARQDLLDMGVDIIDGLQALIARLSAFPLTQLDTKFHAARILSKIRETITLEKWRQLLSKPETERNVEDGALLICLLEYPDLDLDVLRAQLDELAAQFKSRLHVEASGGTEAVMTILQQLSEFLFTELGIRGNADRYYDPKNSFLNDILRRKVGIPVSLSVLYAAIARRVGINIEMVGTPAHFLAKWVSPDGTEIYIDSYGGGKFLNADQCQQLVQYNVPGINFQQSFLDSIPTSQVWTRMLRNLKEQYKTLNHLEKLYAVIRIIFQLTRSPQDIIALVKTRILNEDYEEALNDMQLLDEFNVHTMEIGLDRKLILDKLQEIQTNIIPKIKPPEVLHNVGDVISHKELGYNAVIFGWDSRCTAPVAWQEQVGVNLLTHGALQPFYKCLRHTDARVWTLSYVAQENVTKPQNGIQVVHPFIGKYFKKFDPVNCKFIPTKEMRRRYPSL